MTEEIIKGEVNNYSIEVNYNEDSNANEQSGLSKPLESAFEESAPEVQNFSLEESKSNLIV